MRWVALALVLTIAAVSHGGRGSGVRPLLLRVRGHVGEPRPGDRGVASLVLRRDRDTIAFQVDEIWVLSGNAVGVDVLHEVAPYTPSMSLAGPPALLDLLQRASPETPLEVTGYFRRGARILMLSAVEPTKRE